MLLPDTKSSDRWEKADRRFFDEAFKAAGLSTPTSSIKNAQGDPANQRTQAEQAITEGAKVILLTNLDSGSGAAIIARVQVPGRDDDRLRPPDAEGRRRLLRLRRRDRGGPPAGQGPGGRTSRRPGTQEAGDRDADGAPTDSFATDLKKGYNEVLDAQARVRRVHARSAEQAVPNWDGQQALTIFEQMLQKSSNKIDGVVAANDTIANSMISALKARKLDIVPTTGLDATAGALQHLLAGEQSMTVYFSIKDQATKAANLAVQIARGEKPTGIDDDGRQRRQEGADDLPQAGRRSGRTTSPTR